MKQKRARSEEDKAVQIKKIIDTARDLYLSDRKNFTMRTIARKLGMSQGNLYNYWSSKRELWYAIIKADFKEFEEGMEAVVQEHNGLFINLTDKLADYYFAFAKSNYRRYQMMFVFPPPLAEKEESDAIVYEPGSIIILMKIVQKAVENGELIPLDVQKLALYFWSLVHGTTLVSNTILFSPEAKLAQFGTAKEFQSFVKNLVRKQMEQFLAKK